MHDISLEVGRGEAITVIGSNGAGKSTLLKAIVGMLEGTRGTVSFDGADISRLATHRIARRGLAYVPAERHLFPDMTVAENLALGAFPGRPEPAREDLVFDLFPRLAERRKQHAGTLSGGEQQMLAVGRALMSNPKVLMLDEPTTGLAPRLAAEAYRALARLRDRVSRSSSPSSRCRWPSIWPAAATCWRTDASISPGPPRSCWAIPTSSAPTWGRMTKDGEVR